MNIAETAKIRKTVEDYVIGMTYGDARLLTAAFHPRAASVGHFDGVLEWQDVAEFAAACAADALDRSAPRPPWEIELLRRSGDTAVAIVTNIFAGERFRDTLTLLLEEGRWRIAFKCFHHLR